MAETTGAAIAVGGITLANMMVLTPVAQGGNINLTVGWRVIPATAFFALAMGGLEKLSPMFAKGLVATALITVIVAPFGTGHSVVENLNKILGYGKNG